LRVVRTACRLHPRPVFRPPLSQASKRHSPVSPVLAAEMQMKPCAIAAGIPQGQMPARRRVESADLATCVGPRCSALATIGRALLKKPLEPEEEATNLLGHRDESMNLGQAVKQPPRVRPNLFLGGLWGCTLSVRRAQGAKETCSVDRQGRTATPGSSICRTRACCSTACRPSKGLGLRQHPRRGSSALRFAQQIVRCSPGY
jgi:hypothetical protein